jgi:hypothetical protein
MTGARIVVLAVVFPFVCAIAACGGTVVIGEDSSSSGGGQKRGQDATGTSGSTTSSSSGEGSTGSSSGGTSGGVFGACAGSACRAQDENSFCFASSDDISFCRSVPSVCRAMPTCSCLVEALHGDCASFDCAVDHEGWPSVRCVVP